MTHWPLQRVSLALLQPQLPLLHVDPVPEHTVPHWPQLLESVDRLTHLPPQRVSLALLQPQPPLLHVDPVPEHTVPHWPQLLESVDRLTHLPLQTTSSHGQRVLVRDEKSLCIAA